MIQVFPSLVDRRPDPASALRREQSVNAGWRGTHAAPLTVGARLGNYFMQTGASATTPRQTRRTSKKLRRNGFTPAP